MTTEHHHKRVRNLLAVAATGLMLLPMQSMADVPQPDPLGRSTAVALNYCRASLHRIKRHPSKWVLVEEREKILSNLDLNGIADEEVVRLYAAVLDEITDVRIADKERRLIRERHLRSFVEQAAVSSIALGTQVATAHYAEAIRTGVRSWWDFRTMQWQREIDSWQVEKSRIVAVADKSALFLDTFWKLARKRNIPDHWLIRSHDLDKLHMAMQERNPKVRLRVLKRMEHFMECYPPYWYYVGRTQQAIGQLFAAERTFEKLHELGDGHFRKDDMLAAGLANRAVIQDYLGQSSAAPTAEAALRYSTDVWEVNLVCARVLAHFDRFEEAEDAVLRNLDVGLEWNQSIAYLVALYCHTGNTEQLATQLNDRNVIRSVPAPMLLECAARLGPNALPEWVLAYLSRSLYAEFELHFGRDNFIVHANSNWHLERARLAVSIGDRMYTSPTLFRTNDMNEARFSRILEVGTPIAHRNNPPRVTLTVAYPEMPSIRVELRHVADAGQPHTTQRVGASDVRNAVSLFTPRNNSYQIVAIHVGETSVIPHGNGEQTPITVQPSNIGTSPSVADGRSPGARSPSVGNFSTRTPDSGAGRPVSSWQPTDANDIELSEAPPVNNEIAIDGDAHAGDVIEGDAAHGDTDQVEADDGNADGFVSPNRQP